MLLFPVQEISAYMVAHFYICLKTVSKDHNQLNSLATVTLDSSVVKEAPFQFCTTL